MLVTPAPTERMIVRGNPSCAERSKMSSFLGAEVLARLDPDEAQEMAGYAMDRTADGVLTPEQQTEVIGYLADVIRKMQEGG
jgi:hypothetical protein